MSLTEQIRGPLGFLVILGAGIGLFSLHVAHLFKADEDFVTFLSGIFFPMALSLGLIAGGVWLWYSDLEGWAVLRIGAWCLVGSAVLGGGAVMIILYEQAKGVVLDDTLFVVVDAVSIGSVAGFVVGVYDTRLRRARHAIVVERDRSSRLSQQLTVLNRILRHDIRNGANVISGRAELLDQERSDDEHVAAIKERADALAELGEHARSLEQMLRNESAGLEVVDLAAVVESVGDLVDRQHDSGEVEVSVPETARATVHPCVDLAVEQVVENALEHNDSDRPRVEIRADHVAHDGGEYVEIRVADDGPGIPDAEVDVLERGYETQLDHASGLGLWIVNWIVTESGGEVSFGENEPDGSVVTLRFEAAESDGAAAR